MRNIREEKSFFEGTVTLPAIAGALNRIYKTVDKDGLTQENSVTLKDELQTVADHFGISPKAAVLLAHITEQSGGNGSDEDDLSRFVGCSNIEFIGFREDLSAMEKRGVVARASTRGRRCFYVVSAEAEKSIGTGCEYKPFPWDGLGPDEFFTRIRIIVSDYKKDLIDCCQMLDNLWALVDGNPDLPFCRKVADSGIRERCTPAEQRFLFYLCHRYVSFGDPCVPLERLFGLLDYMDDDQRFRRALVNENTNLQRMGLVAFAGEGALTDTESLRLTDDVTKSWFPDIQVVMKSDAPAGGLVTAASITARELFYNPDVTAQMDRLAALLEPENFAGVQKRLGEMGMRKGFAVLFAGGAGCGKTAGAYELARRSGRDIMAVDMSQLKSKWVGDSEKIVKGVFTTYAQLCRTREKAPILLFNEADAIFARRIENPDDSVDQMMNAIQNICLDAIENLDGILIATTNLADNFCDEAFARRFIIKVNFTTPEPATRARIWRSMLPSLKEDQAEILGERYAFSGGNIENIARKAAVGYVLSGTPADFGELTRYCDEETLACKGQTRRIGF